MRNISFAVRREPLDLMITLPEYGNVEVHREGFPHFTPAEFVDFFCWANKVKPYAAVTRLEFRYIINETRASD